MAKFTVFGGGKDSSESNGEDFQCDCPVNTCGCGDWGPWIPAGKPIPDTVICDQCRGGKHDDGTR